jgi:hypothetical protein
MLTLREQTNCREGPGQDYDVLFTYLKGVRLEIVGNYPQKLLVCETTDSATGVCWLWGEYADVIALGCHQCHPTAYSDASAPKPPSVEWEFNCNLQPIKWIPHGLIMPRTKQLSLDRTINPSLNCHQYYNL